MTQFAKKLRGILEKAGKLDVATGDTLLAEAQAQKRPFTEVLVNKGVATELELVALISKAANIPPIDLSKLNVNKEAHGRLLRVALTGLRLAVPWRPCLIPLTRVTGARWYSGKKEASSSSR